MGFIFFNRVRETMKMISILKRHTLLWWERAPASSWMCCHCLYLYIQVNGCSVTIWGHTVVNHSVSCAFSRVRLVLQVFLIEHKDNTAAMSVFIFWLTNNIKKTLKKLPQVHDWFLGFFSFSNVFASSSSLCAAEQGFCEVIQINRKVELTSGVLQVAIKSLQVHSCLCVCVYHFHMTSKQCLMIAVTCGCVPTSLYFQHVFSTSSSRSSCSWAS